MKNKIIENKEKLEKATFAGGCFWCTESHFKEIGGVKKVVSGYSGGAKENPTYEEVSSGTTGHREAIQIVYNPKEISYKQLLEKFWRSIDPFDEEGQFSDKGSEYTTAIFYHNEKQKKMAEKSKKEIEEELGRKTFVRIIKFEKFWPAEKYHQNYYKKCQLRYKTYRHFSGRDQRLKEIWEG